MKRRPLVFVEWEDSYGCSSRWQDIDQAAEPKVLLCHSVGWIINETAKCIVLVPHVTTGDVQETHQGCGDMTIPTAAIVRRVALSITERKRRA